jgi:hypothetical protein
MPELEIIPHPEQQRTFFELREEFRTENQKRIHQLLKSHPIGWGVIGDSEKARDRYTADAWAQEMLARLDTPVQQDFGLGDAPFTLSVRLERLANESMVHEMTTWDDSVEGVVDHDAPACADVMAMSDEELCDYVDRSIRESECG